MKTKTFLQCTGILLLGFGSGGLVQATELVYTPVNPSFGGNPLNGTWLLNNAQAQNDYDDPDLKNRTAVAGKPNWWHHAWVISSSARLVAA